MRRGGVEFLEKGPPAPPALAIPCSANAGGGEGSFACSSNSPALNRSSKLFSTTLSSPLPHALITLPHIISQSFASTTPRSTM